MVTYDDCTDATAGSTYSYVVSYSQDSTYGTSTGHTGETINTRAGSVDFRIFQPRHIIAPLPEHWTKEQIREWVNLINHRTNTGWNVEMIIFGDVMITDPDIELREMEAMLQLLKKRAGPGDREAIDAFMAANGLADTGAAMDDPPVDLDEDNP